MVRDYCEKSRRKSDPLDVGSDEDQGKTGSSLPRPDSPDADLDDGSSARG